MSNPRQNDSKKTQNEEKSTSSTSSIVSYMAPASKVFSFLTDSLRSHLATEQITIIKDYILNVKKGHKAEDSVLMTPVCVTSNGKLLDDETFDELSKKFNSKPHGLYSEEILNKKYKIFNGKNGVYVMYEIPTDFYKGSCGEIQLAQHQSGKFYAVKFQKRTTKILSKSPEIKIDSKKIIDNEFFILDKLGLTPDIMVSCKEDDFFQSSDPQARRNDSLAQSADSLVQSVGSVEQGNDVKGALSQWWVFLMDYYEGKSALDFLNERLGTHTVYDKLEIAVEMTKAVSSLHDKGIIHCDLHSTNFIINDETQVRLIDMGFAKYLGKENSMKDLKRQYPYFLPEALKTDTEQVEYSKATDAYQIGVMLRELLLCQRRDENFKFIPKSSYRDPLENNTDLKLLDKLTAENPAERSNLSFVPDELNKILCKEKELHAAKLKCTMSH